MHATGGGSCNAWNRVGGIALAGKYLKLNQQSIHTVSCDGVRLLAGSVGNGSALKSLAYE